TTGADVPCHEYFVFTPVLKQFPAALWGQSMTPDQSSLRKPSLIGPNLAGFEIRPGRQSGVGQAKAVKASETIEVPRGSLQFSSIPAGNYTWGTSGVAFKASTDQDAARRETIKNTITAEAVTAARHAVLAALEFPADAVALNSTLVAQFEIPPQVRA
ncbi:MAG TPA: hypothetical protein VEY08_06555, partial [Chloroflexia bacterium]|nr:hypothetical protein [Chloroflexia bacterium]